MKNKSVCLHTQGIFFMENVLISRDMGKQEQSPVKGIHWLQFSNGAPHSQGVSGESIKLYTMVMREKGAKVASLW